MDSKSFAHVIASDVSTLPLEQFKGSIDWRATFDAAFGLEPRNLAAEDYFGPIDTVVAVYAASRSGQAPHHAMAVVEFERKSAPARYALITSHVNADNSRVVGKVTYFQSLSSYLTVQ